MTPQPNDRCCEFFVLRRAIKRRFPLGDILPSVMTCVTMSSSRRMGISRCERCGTPVARFHLKLLQAPRCKHSSKLALEQRCRLRCNTSKMVRQWSSRETPCMPVRVCDSKGECDTASTTTGRPGKSRPRVDETPCSPLPAPARPFGSSTLVCSARATVAASMSAATCRTACSSQWVWPEQQHQQPDWFTRGHQWQWYRTVQVGVATDDAPPRRSRGASAVRMRRSDARMSSSST